MKYTFFFCFIVSLFISDAAFAQPKTDKKLEAAIESLGKTAFIKELKKCKQQIEANVADFKVTKEVDEKDIRKVKRAYAETQEKFDGILNGLKKDLMTKANRDFIIANPDRYTDFTKKSLQETMDDYQSNCQSLIDKATGKAGSTALVALVELLVPSINNLVSYFQDYKKALNTANEAFIEAKLIQKLRLKAWDSLE